MANDTLLEQDRIKLDGIVSKMIANKESDSNIQFVVNDFKSKYIKNTTEKVIEPTAPKEVTPPTTKSINETILANATVPNIPKTVETALDREIIEAKNFQSGVANKITDVTTKIDEQFSRQKFDEYQKNVQENDIDLFPKEKYEQMYQEWKKKNDSYTNQDPNRVDPTPSILKNTFDSAIKGVGQFLKDSGTIEPTEKENIINPLEKEKTQIDNQVKKLEAIKIGFEKSQEIEKKVGKPIEELTYDEISKEVNPNQEKRIGKYNQLADFYDNAGKVIGVMTNRFDYLAKDNKENINQLSTLKDAIEKAPNDDNKNLLIDQYNTILNSPNYQAYVNAGSKLAEIKNDNESKLKADVKLALLDQETNDYNANKGLATQFLTQAPKTLDKLVGGLATLPETIAKATGMNIFSIVTKPLSQIGENLNNKADMVFSPTGKTNTESFYEYTYYKGSKLLIKDDGQAYSIRDNDLNELPDNNGLIEEWNNLPKNKKTPTRTKFNPISSLYGTTQVVSDMIPYLAGGEIIGGAKLAGGSFKAAQYGMGLTITVAQTHNQIYDQLKDNATVSEQERSQVALAGALAIGIVNMGLGGYEQRLLGATENKLLKETITESIPRIINGEIKGLDIAKQFFKKVGQNAGKEIPEELVQELFTEPIAQNVVNDIADKVYGSDIENQKIDFESMKEQVIPIILGTGIMGSVGSVKGKNSLQQDALWSAVNNIDNFKEIVRSQVSNNTMTQAIAEKTVNIVDKISNTLNDSNNLSDVDKFNISNLMFNNEQLQSKAESNIADVLKTKYKERIKNNNDLISKLINGDKLTTNEVINNDLEDNNNETTTTQTSITENIQQDTSPSNELPLANDNVSVVPIEQRIKTLEKRIKVATVKGEDVTDLQSELSKLKTNQDAVQIEITDATLSTDGQGEQKSGDNTNVELQKVEIGNQESQAVADTRKEEVTNLEVAPILVSEPSKEQQLKDINNGDIVSFTYNSEAEVPDVFKDKISSKGEINGKKYVKVSVAKSLADYELSKQQPQKDGVAPIPVSEVEATPISKVETKKEVNAPITVSEVENKAVLDNRKRKDLFPDESEFSTVVGDSKENSKISNYREVNGVGIAEYSNPENGLVDVIMSGTSNNDYVGYVRVYENGKPTNRWTSKMENKSQNKANLKIMLAEVQKSLPQGHEYTEKTNISLDGLKTYAQQLNYGYEVLTDSNGNPVMNQVPLNKASVDALQNTNNSTDAQSLFENVELGNSQREAEKNFETEKQKILSKILPLLEKLGLSEKDIIIILDQSGQVDKRLIGINLPVLKSTKAVETLLANQPKKEEVVPTQDLNKTKVIELQAQYNSLTDAQKMGKGNEIMQELQPLIKELGYSQSNNNGSLEIKDANDNVIGENTKLQSTNAKFKTITQKAFGKLIDKLKKAFPNTKVEYFNGANFENAKTELAKSGKIITNLKTKDGTIYGFKTPDGKVFLNTDNINANTPIHEFAHVWQSMFPKSFEVGLNLLKNSKIGQQYINQIANNPAYAGKTQQEIENEALVTAIGDKGESLNNRNLAKKLMDWFNGLITKVGQRLGVKINADSTFERFTKGAIGELLGGKELVSQGTEENTVLELQVKTDTPQEKLDYYNKLKDLAQEFKADGDTNEQIKELLGSDKFIDKNINDIINNVDKSEKDFAPKEEDRSFVRATEALDEDVAPLLENSTYIPATNKQQEIDADNFIDEHGVELATSKLLSNDLSGMSDDVINVIAQKLIRINNKSGNFKESARILDQTMEKLTEAGRLIQTATLWNLMTPEGAVIFAQRLTKKGKEKFAIEIGAKVEDIDKKIARIIDEINASKEVKIAIARLFKTDRKIRKTKSEKAIEWLDSIKIKGKMFSTIPGVELLPATYNTAIEIIKTGIKAGIIINKVLDGAIKHIKENLTADDKFNEREFIKFFTDKLPKIQNDGLRDAEKELGKTIAEITKEHFTVSDKLKDDLTQKLIDKAGLDADEAIRMRQIIEAQFDKAAAKNLSSLEKANKRKEDARIKNQQGKEGIIDAKIVDVQKDIDALNNGTYKKPDGKLPTIKTDKEKELSQLRKEKKNLRGWTQEYTKILNNIKAGKVVKEDIKDLLYEDIGLSDMNDEDMKEIERLHQRVLDSPDGSSEQKNRLQDLMGFVESKAGGLDNYSIMKSLLYASILSGTKTQLKNVISNTFQTMSDLMVNGIYEAIANKDYTSMGNLIKNLLIGYKRGILEAKKIISTGYDPQKSLLSLDSNPKIGRLDSLENKAINDKMLFKGKLNPLKAANFVKRLMIAADTFFYYGLNEMESGIVARRLALESGLKGKELQKEINRILFRNDDSIKAFRDQAYKEGFVTDESVKRRVFELIQQMRPADMRKRADKNALKSTYNNDPTGSLGYLSKQIASFVQGLEANNKLLGAVATSIFPFTRVIANVVNEQLNLTPLGIIRGLTNKGSINPGAAQDYLTNEEKAKLTIKGIMGTTIMIGFILRGLADDNDDDPYFSITANGYGNSQDNSKLYDLGWQPYTLKFGNYRYNYQATPMGQMLGIVGTVLDNHKYNNDKDNTEKLGILVSAGINQIMNASSLQGASNLFDAVGSTNSSNQNKIIQLVFDKAKMPIPNISKEAYKLFDNNLYDKKDMLGMLVYNVPIAQMLGKPKINVWGDEIKVSRYNIVTKPDKVDLSVKLFNSGITPSYPSKLTKVNGQLMTEEQFYEYSKIRGSYLKQYVEDVIEDIINEPDIELAKDIFDREQNLATEQAKIDIAKKYQIDFE